ncbi:hypothetical protein NDU88_011649 [Pleurodeles waltl]|uniref:Uncharacterized protein n=1 Tax=Pleurodeles waltl TaxID=8319 RepID=A0AAV7S4U3_PLEWA|nr:hypothetical protein NDU88_011649 [Pleurodeles waltl]
MDVSEGGSSPKLRSGPPAPGCSSCPHRGLRAKVWIAQQLPVVILQALLFFAAYTRGLQDWQTFCLVV